MYTLNSKVLINLVVYFVQVLRGVFIFLQVLLSCLEPDEALWNGNIVTIYGELDIVDGQPQILAKVSIYFLIYIL